MSYSIFDLIKFFFGFMLLGFISSCYPGEDIYEADDLDIVLTLYDEEADFSSKKTYALPDSIISIDDGGVLTLLRNDFDDQILEQVRANLEAYGWKEVQPGESSDVVVLLYKVTTVNVEAYSYADYWWNWWGWYPYWGAYPVVPGAGWSPYYPWGGTVVYSYQTGTLLIDMIDPNKAGPESMTIPSIWGAGINGLLEGANEEISNRLTDNINQVFDQSPYLNLN